MTAFVVGAFYSLDALNTERRDGSILFWKSMPVSDTIAVLSKAFVPIAVIPVIGFAIALVTQALLLVLGALTEAFKPNALNDPITSLSQLDPARFLCGPGLWLGLVAAAAFLAAAIHLRRSREPLR